jgi:hypothetical protein
MATMAADQMTIDLLKMSIDRVREVYDRTEQLLESDEARIFVLSGIAAACAHDATHIMSDATGKSLAKCWVDTMENIAHAMCRGVEASMREEMKARR